MDEIVQEFLVESYENLEQLDRDLVTLEQQPDDSEILSRVFRTIHTIKGTCGFLGYSKLESVTHVGESLLARLREGELVLDPDIANTLLAMTDAVRQILSSIESVGDEGPGDYHSVIEALTAVQTTEAADIAASAAAAPKRRSTARKSAPRTEAAIETQTGSPPAAAEIEGPESTGGRIPETTIPAAIDESHLAPDGKRSRSSVAESTIRVDVALLDTLMDLVGELVLARNQVLQLGEVKSESGFTATSQRLNLVTSELQEGVMKTRLQPIGNLWQKLPRIVRDVSAVSGKKVHLELEGNDTELDKSIVEAIADPITHLVRNAIDHGIETTDERLSRGKPGAGTLSMRAYHEGGQVNIEVADDGAGINAARLKTRALENGVATPEQVARMSDGDALQLIFLPGFSTSSTVTNLSGRGVGMDVVKTNIEAIGGTVDVHSAVGVGTTFRLKIPLTLAIIPALVVVCRGQRYAIPQVNLLELVRADNRERGIEMIHGTPVYRLRGKLLPLVHLDQELALATSGELETGPTTNIVVLQADDKQFGLIVDKIADTQEIVVKGLGRQFKHVPIFAGATILGDGKVALILDVLGLGQRARVVSERSEHGLIEERSHDEERAAQGGEQLLVFTLDGEGRLAVPLSAVARLEEFPRELIEHSSNRDVVQYRDDILPLIHLDQVIPGGGDLAGPATKSLQVIVHITPGGHSVGLVVGGIVDIAEGQASVDAHDGAAGICGTSVVQGRVTDIVDVEEIVRRAAPSLVDNPVGVS